MGPHEPRASLLYLGFIDYCKGGLRCDAATAAYFMLACGTLKSCLSIKLNPMGVVDDIASAVPTALQPEQCSEQETS